MKQEVWHIPETGETGFEKRTNAAAVNYEGTVHPFCSACSALLNRVEECARRLKEASSRLRLLVGAKKANEFAEALRQAESLRMECGTVRAEAQRHYAEHRSPHI